MVNDLAVADGFVEPLVTALFADLKGSTVTRFRIPGFVSFAKTHTFGAGFRWHKRCITFAYRR
jgi:hypothetical protein